MISASVRPSTISRSLAARPFHGLDDVSPVIRFAQSGGGAGPEGQGLVSLDQPAIPGQDLNKLAGFLGRDPAGQERIIAQPKGKPDQQVLLEHRRLSVVNQLRQKEAGGVGADVDECD